MCAATPHTGSVNSPQTSTYMARNSHTLGKSKQLIVKCELFVIIGRFRVVIPAGIP